MTTFVMMMMGNPQSMGKLHHSLTLLDHFEQSGNIVDFEDCRIIPEIFFHFRTGNNDKGVLYRLTEIVRIYLFYLFI